MKTRVIEVDGQLMEITQGQFILRNGFVEPVLARNLITNAQKNFGIKLQIAEAIVLRKPSVELGCTTENNLKRYYFATKLPRNNHKVKKASNLLNDAVSAYYKEARKAKAL